MKTLQYIDLLTDVKDIIEIKFYGNNPARLLKIILPLMQKTMEINSPKLAEREVKWDSTDGSFLGRWAAFKPYDSWTSMWIDAVAWGSQDLQTKQGGCRIKLKGCLITKFDYANSLQKGFWWTYTNIFYNRVRRKLFDSSREYYFKIADEIKRELGILQENPTTIPVKMA